MILHHIGYVRFNDQYLVEVDFCTAKRHKFQKFALNNLNLIYSGIINGVPYQCTGFRLEPHISMEKRDN